MNKNLVRMNLPLARMNKNLAPMNLPLARMNKNLAPMNLPLARMNKNLAPMNKILARMSLRLAWMNKNLARMNKNLAWESVPLASDRSRVAALRLRRPPEPPRLCCPRAPLASEPDHAPTSAPGRPGLLRAALVWTFRRVVAVYFRAIESTGDAPTRETAGRIFVANHYNALVDPILVVTAAPCPISPIAKSTLWKIPGLKCSSTPAGRSRSSAARTTRDSLRRRTTPSSTRSPPRSRAEATS